MYQAWLKTHFPVEFWASKLQSAETNIEDKESVWALRAVAMEEGVKFGEFSVNTCGHEIRIDKEDKVFWRLDFVKGVGTGAAALIRKCSPYINVEDLSDKTTKYFKKLKADAIKSGIKLSGNCPVGKSAIMALIAAGAFDSVYEGKVTRYQIAAEYLKKYYAKKWSLINSHVDGGVNSKLTAAQIRDIAFLKTIFSPISMLGLQYEVLRFAPRPIWKMFSDSNPNIKPGVVASMLRRTPSGASVNVYGLASNVEIKKYNGGKLISCTVNEYDGKIHCIAFDDFVRSNKKIISNIVDGVFVHVVGNVKDDAYRGGGEKQVFMTKIERMDGEEEAF
jgi:DNA polymerase III alpha subunit